MVEHIDVRGWLVSEAEARPIGFGGPDSGRVLLFRGPQPDRSWSLLQVSHHTTWNADAGLPVDGWAQVRSEAYASLAEVRAAMGRSWSTATWRELVRAGAENPPHDPELSALWVPVRIDLDLEKSSVHRREYGVGAVAGQEPEWESDALLLAVNRLAELGFVLVEQTAEAADLFPWHLVKGWGNTVIGAVRAAARGHAVRLLVAVDDFGEIYARSGDTGFDPGVARRYPPRPLTKREAQQVEEVYQRRRSEALRRFEGEG